MSSVNMSEQVRERVEEVYQTDSRRVFATLIRLLGDFDRAEEALHDAFAAAVEQWPRDGIPANPRAWLVSAGRFKAIDAMRRRARFDASLAELAERLEADTSDPAPASLIRRHSDQPGTSRPGSGWCRSSTRARAKTGPAVSANKAIAICAACSRLAPLPSSVMPRSKEPSIDLGSQHCWLGGDRTGEQDRQNGVGHDGQGRALQGTRRASGVTEIRPAIRRDVKVGRANST